MTAAVLPLSIEQGATFVLTLQWASTAGTDFGGNPTPGRPHDLTGASARMQIRRSHQAPALVDGSTENEMIALGGPDGTITVQLPADATEKLQYKRAMYDLTVQLATGHVVRLLEGPVAVSLGITRSHP